MTRTVLATLGHLCRPERKDGLIRTGLHLLGRHYQVEAFVEARPDTLCGACRHGEHNCASPKMARCALCAERHRTSDRQCSVEGRRARKGTVCVHAIDRCPNCKRHHSARSAQCPKRKGAIEDRTAQCCAQRRGYCRIFLFYCTSYTRGCATNRSLPIHALHSPQCCVGASEKQ